MTQLTALLAGEGHLSLPPPTGYMKLLYYLPVIWVMLVIGFRLALVSRDSLVESVGVTGRFKRIASFFAPFVTDDDIKRIGVSHLAVVEGEDAILIEDEPTGPTRSPYHPFTIISAIHRFRRSNKELVITLCLFVELGLHTVMASLIGTYTALSTPRSWDWCVLFLALTVAWAYFALKEAIRPSQSAPLSLLVFLLLILTMSITNIVRYFHDKQIETAAIFLVYHQINLKFCILASICILPMPLNAGLGEIELKNGRPKSPEDTNTLIGALTYEWMNSIMATATQRPLLPSDVWNLSLNNQAEILSTRFKELSERSLVWRLLRANAFDVLVDFMLKLFAVTANYLKPFFVQKVLENLTLSVMIIPGVVGSTSAAFLASDVTLLLQGRIMSPLEGTEDAYSTQSTNTQSTWKPHERAYVYAFLAFASMIFKSITELQHFHHARRVGMRTRSEITSAVFEKTLRRKNLSGHTSAVGADKASVGKVISLISEDVNNLLRLGCDAHLVYGAPLEIIIACVMLFNLMGWSAFAGFSILVGAVPVNYWLGKRAMRIARSRSAARDARQTSTQDLLGSIRAIKLFGWTAPWTAKVEAKREEEVAWLFQEFTNRFFITCLWMVISFAVPLVSFYFYVAVAKRQLSVAVAFTALALFKMVKTPLVEIPGFGIRLLQVSVAINRIESYFMEDEIEDFMRPEARETGWYSAQAAAEAEAAYTEFLDPNLPDPNVSSSASDFASASSPAFTHATLVYPDTSPDDFCLRGLNCVFPKAGLTVIHGATGSGKSSVLKALLGELDILSGTVFLPSGAISYCDQHPWLESTSLRNNILFGFPLDESRYQLVLEHCALVPDLQNLADGDETFIGERGIALSGGQKARIALARAIYAPSHCVLLDDIFAAIDAQTSRFLVEHLFQGPLVANRTVVLVTHHLSVLRDIVDYEIEMKDGVMVYQGALRSLKRTESEGRLSRRPSRQKLEVSSHSSSATLGGGNGTFAASGSSTPSKRTTAPTTGQTAEAWNQGNVASSIYLAYLRTSSPFIWAILVFFLVVQPVFSFAEQYWLRLWGEAVSADNAYFLGGYAVIGLIISFVTLTSMAISYYLSLSASRRLFTQLLDAVVNATLRWFDVTPLGRISNRFANDFSIIDEQLAQNFYTFAGFLISAVSSFIITSAILPVVFVPISIFGGVYLVVFLRYFYVRRDLNRIASTTASPIFASFQESLVGITTIRAFNKEEEYRAAMCRMIDDTLSVWYCGCTLDVWLSIRTQILSAVCLLTTAECAVYMGVSPGLAGIAITSSLTIIESLNWVCNSFGQLAMNLNSLERVTEYLAVEQDRNTGAVPPPDWPAEPELTTEPYITGHDVVIKYAPELPNVIDHITFNIYPHERVAITGRTGSGKSTLVMSLLGFVDPSEGQIVIDGHDISRVSLTELRRRVTYLPQEAILFSGTIRENLDPFNEHTDEECLAALRQIHLNQESSHSGAVSPSMFELDSMVASGGFNFSAGQRQLISLARALLKNSHIIIFDESTAALSHELDQVVQETIRKDFKHATIITIAHRLQTIMDYDIVMVLDKGRIIESGRPRDLVDDPSSCFHNLCLQTGQLEELKDMIGGA